MEVEKPKKGAPRVLGLASQKRGTSCAGVGYLYMHDVQPPSKHEGHDILHYALFQEAGEDGIAWLSLHNLSWLS